jgi:hypothetical protein
MILLARMLDGSAGTFVLNASETIGGIDVTAGGDLDTGVRDLEQALQQCVNQSPWTRCRCARRLAERLTQVLQPEAWVVYD